MRRLLLGVSALAIAMQASAAVDPAARGLAAGAARPPLTDGWFRLSAKSDQSFAAWRERSMRINAAAYADATAGEYYEPWMGTANWSANSWQVSGGRAYANGGAGATAGITHGWALGAGDQGRAVIPVNLLPIAGSITTIVGVSSDAAGAVPASGGSSARGLSISTQTINCWDRGTATPIATGLTAGAAIAGNVTISIDATTISVVLAVTGSATEYRCQFARTAAVVNNLYLYLGDSRGLSGNSIGPMVARRGFATSTPGLGLEAAGRNVQWTKVTSASGASNAVKIVTPPGYDSRTPSPAVVMFHGHGSNENLFSDNAGQQPAYMAFLNAGYVLISTACTAAPSSWGAGCSLDAYDAAVRYARDHYAIGSIGFYANSMGGIESELMLADRRIPGVSWWIGHSPTFSLADSYAPQAGFGDFSAAINTAYGASSYATIPAGHDPAQMDARAFRGVPMMILSAGDDVTVNPVANGQALARAAGPYAPELAAPAGITGGHAFGLSAYTAAMIAFANRYAGN